MVYKIRKLNGLEQYRMEWNEWNDLSKQIYVGMYTKMLLNNPVNKLQFKCKKMYVCSSTYNM